MKTISTQNAPGAVGPYSQGIMSGGFVFFSGQIGLDKNGIMQGDDTVSQSKQIFKNIDALLEAVNLAKTNIVKVTIFLSDIKDFEILNQLYSSYFGHHKPARSCVEISALPKNAKVEIEVLAEEN